MPKYEDHAMLERLLTDLEKMHAIDPERIQACRQALDRLLLAEPSPRDWPA